MYGILALELLLSMDKSRRMNKADGCAPAPPPPKHYLVAPPHHSPDCTALGGRHLEDGTPQQTFIHVACWVPNGDIK